MDEKKVKKSNEQDKPEKKDTKKAQDNSGELLERLDSLKKEADDYKDKWMRTVAEFDNYKKRNAKIYSDAFDSGAFETIKKFLPLGDTLEYALTIGLDEKTAEGIKGIIKKYDGLLKDMGIEEINPIGTPFDPNIAEAVMQVEKSDENDISDNVKQVFQKGYKLNDKIIRYAKVSVIK